MTEVANMIPTDHRVSTVRHYEAGPPPGLELVEPGDTFATTKEEEWVSKKKKEITNTRQIETRVKRQVVLEDGKVVEDTGPMVTTNTTEDTETKEHQQTELRKLGDDDNEQKALEGDGEDRSKWISVPNPDGVVREVKERRVLSHEEREEHRETEDIQHLGDITDEDFLAAVNSGKSDIRKVLRTKDGDRTVVSTGPRLINESSKSNKTIDTEDTRELSSVLPDGRIITETERTTEHEVVKDDELPEGAPEQDDYKESSQRYFKSREQEDVDYLADGVNIGHEMRYRTENIEVEKNGDCMDDSEWDSLTARARKRGGGKPQQRYRGTEHVIPIDRKDALTKRLLDFDVEEETRKQETSKWLEHHFGSDSRSSNNSLDELDDEKPPKTSFFNVTIKSQPTRVVSPPKTYVTNISNHRNNVYSPAEPERERGYFQGVSEWSERRSPLAIRARSPTYDDYRASPKERTSPPERYIRNDYSPPERFRDVSPAPDYRERYREVRSHDYRRVNESRSSPFRELTPTPPQRKRGQVRKQKEDSRGYRGYRTPSREEEIEEPAPDYSPPTPPPMEVEKKQHKSKVGSEGSPKSKSGNIIGQSIRKLVGKIRSASAERKARQRAKRSPSPSYHKGHVIDNIQNGNGYHHEPSQKNHHRGQSPVQRYYLGEDPFGGSIYGKENKYDGVRPIRSSRRQHHEPEDLRSQSTLGRLSKSTSRLAPRTTPTDRVSQTLPRNPSKQHPRRDDNTINVSIINTVSSPRPPISNGAPAKPARTYKSNLSRSKSLNVHGVEGKQQYKSNPQLHRLDESPLKSPALISNLSRSQRDLSERVVEEEEEYTGRFGRNGYGGEEGWRSGNRDTSDSKRIFLKSLKDRAPELFKTLHDDEESSWKSPRAYSTPQKPPRIGQIDTFEAPTRLYDTKLIRRGSNSSNDFSETYHTTSHNDDPVRPTVTDTVQSYSRKTVSARNGRGVETIESTEKKSVTKSRYRDPGGYKYYDSDSRARNVQSPVVIEVRNNYRK